MHRRACYILSLWSRVLLTVKKYLARPAETGDNPRRGTPTENAPCLAISTKSKATKLLNKSKKLKQTLVGIAKKKLS